MSEGESVKTKASDWEDWKKTCAYLDCSEDARRSLGPFGSIRMRKQLSRIHSHLVSVFDRVEDKSLEAWQYLDVHIALKDNRSGLHGKPCKDWLFDNPKLDTVSKLEQYMSTGFFRSAAQDYAKHNLPSDAKSISAPLGPDDDGPTIEDLISDENIGQASSLIIKEYREAAQEAAAKVFDGLDDVSRIALAASELDITLDSPKVKNLTGKGKSALYDRVKSAEDQAFSELKTPEGFAEYAGSQSDEASCEQDAKQIVSNFLRQMCVEWAKVPENPANELFE